MHRAVLLDSLDAYGRLHPDEEIRVTRIRRFVDQHRDCFERSCLTGHITASSWIESAERDCFLLVRHRQLGTWLQLGGHADGETDTAAVALREAREESGLDDFRFVPGRGGGRLPFDVDVHRIPATASVAAHDHYDIRYLLQAEKLGPLRVSAESDEVRWFGYEEADAVLHEESLRRMARKAHLLRGIPATPLRDARSSPTPRE